MENHSAQERAFPYVSNCPNSERLSAGPEVVHVPVIDLAKLKQGNEERPLIVKEVRDACSKMGFFQVT